MRTEASLRQRLSFLESENALLKARVQDSSAIADFQRLTAEEQSLVLKMVNILVTNREGV